MPGIQGRRESMTGRWTFWGSGVLVLFLIMGFHGKGLGEEHYSVKSGDNLYTLSKSFGVSVEAIKGVNRLRSDSLRPKQVLLIPIETRRLQEEANQKPPVETQTYIVKRGETLHTISKSAGTSVEEIKKLNKLTSTVLKIGQVLLLPKVEREEEFEEDGDAEEMLLEPVAQKEEQNQEIPVPGERRNGSQERNLLVRVVKTFLGVPYRLGGSTLKGIDCSAFVKKIYEIFNVDLPRTAREQFRFGKKVDKGQLEKGDLVFFKTRRGENTHVGIYIGNSEFVHASSNGKEVKIDNLEAPYFNQRFMKGVRVKEFEYETSL
jgi:peptidoglycan DL-endopeptidase LytE